MSVISFLIKLNFLNSCLIVGAILSLGLFGCSADRISKTAQETSGAHSLLEDKVSFLSAYGFGHRRYKQVEYDVWYQDNSGGFIPGPSDWGIKILAIVLADEVDQWIPSDASAIELALPQWVRTMPGDINIDGLDEWYGDPNSLLVGVDRRTSTIAYRHLTC